MDITRPTHFFPYKVEFSFCTRDEIHNISVQSITNPQLTDDLGRPTPHGLYDPSLGPILRTDRCITCGILGYDCLGHFGHIDLYVPVFNPLTFPLMMTVLKNTCMYCNNFLHPTIQKSILFAKLKLIDCGLFEQIGLLDEYLNESLMKAFGSVLNLIDNVHADEETSQSNSSTEKPSKLNPAQSAARKSEIVQLAINQFISRLNIDESQLDEFRMTNAAVTQRIALIHDFLALRSSSRKCSSCGGINQRVKSLENAKVFQYPLQSKQSREMVQKGLLQSQTISEHIPEQQSAAIVQPKLLTPLAIQNHFKKLWVKEKKLLDLVFGSNPPIRTSTWEMFFQSVVPVPPNRFRPMNVMGDQTFEHPQNTYLTEILKTNQRIAKIAVESANDKALNEDEPASGKKPSLKNTVDSWLHLQQQVNYLFDSSKNSSGQMGKEPPNGIKQILEKKEGLFRKHMMGKRVNYSARTVISPDPNLDCSEIGVPMVFAKKLTYPEPVTRYNYALLRQAVINGPSCHPGATHIQREDGFLVSLEGMSIESRTTLANQLLTATSASSTSASTSSSVENSPVINNGKRVYRHLRNGDILLLNRQPTLHRPSIMGHKCRVLEGEKVLRMHYVNCESYNADFDGDEMNIHLPQNEIARSEGYNITSTDFQYLAVTDGEPLRGLIQDHVGSAVWLTLKDTFLSQERYNQLIYGCFTESGRIRTVPPAIQRPFPLWTGKQLISTILLNILPSDVPLPNIEAPCKINSKNWPTPEDGHVIIIHGYMATGILDKSQIGNAAFGLTHAIHELYGGVIANKFLSAVGKCLTKWLQMTAYTCRLDDMMLTEETNSERSQIISQSTELGTEVSLRYAKLTPEQVLKTPALKQATFERIVRSTDGLTGLDGAMKGAMNKLTSKIIQTCLPSGQLIPFPHNNMSLMTVSGAKGSNVNFSQISCLLGQQELEGKRVPVMTSGKTLPVFLPYETRARAGGYISSRFLTGISPDEFFFHCMAGREGLIDTAIKTARSGYLQRCLVKHLESLCVSYDCTVRNRTDNSIVQFFYGEDGLDVLKQKYIQRMEFVAKNFDCYLKKYKPEVVLDKLDVEKAPMLKQLEIASEKERTGGSSSSGKNAANSSCNTIMNQCIPTRFLGSVSEKFSSLLESFIVTNQHTLLSGRRSKGGIRGVTVAKFRALMWLKFLHSLADPGESVGLLAAQSVGEPSTQMTLNTFHLAGFGAKNVTLGVPRLREIIMTGSKRLSTPTMTLPLRSSLEHMDEQSLTSLANAIGKVTLKDIVSTVSVSERIVRCILVGTSDKKSDLNGVRCREYEICIKLISADKCKSLHNVSGAEIREVADDILLRKLVGVVSRAIKKSYKQTDSDGVISVRNKAFGMNAAEKEPEDESVTVENETVERGKESDVSSESESESENESESESDSDNDSANDSDVESKSDEKPVTEEIETLPPRTDSSKFKHHMIKERSYIPNSNEIHITLTLPATTSKLLMLELVEHATATLVLHDIQNITKCYFNPDDLQSNTPITLHTEGVNLRGIWDLDQWIDTSSIYTNDIHATLECYGIEAARALLVREMVAVFDVYGIAVDYRHLSLIADQMTADGMYRSFNRASMHHSAASAPLLQMSFETVMSFMRESAVFATADWVQSPSSRIVVGVPAAVGTGMFKVVQQFE